MLCILDLSAKDILLFVDSFCKDMYVSYIRKSCFSIPHSAPLFVQAITIAVTYYPPRRFRLDETNNKN